jgi:endonuclease VIII
MSAVPEGHTIHRIARDQFSALGHQALAVSSPQGRFAPGAALVDGGILAGIDAWGKHLFYRFDSQAQGEQQIHVHLGLFGKFFRFDGPATATARQVRLRLAGPAVGFDLTGPTACEVITTEEVKAVTDRLGPDPLRRDADPARAWAKLARRRSPVGVAIMDQSVVSGVGNVFRAESLFLHGIHPERPCHTLEVADWDALWATLVRMLRAGVRTGAIVTVPRRDPTVHDGRTRYVYKQERCARCGTPVRRWDLAGRWAYACERCQPPWPA